jgi:hypothetical protein
VFEGEVMEEDLDSLMLQVETTLMFHHETSSWWWTICVE